MNSRVSNSLMTSVAGGSKHLNFLLLPRPGNRPCAGGGKILGCGSTSLTLGRGKVNDVAVALEHVDLLDSLDGLDVELLEGLLQLLVIGAGSLGCALHLPARGALAADA